MTYCEKPREKNTQPATQCAVGMVFLNTDEALALLPVIEQTFVNAPAEMDTVSFEQHLYIARRRCEKAIEPNDDVFYIPSLSSRVISYKGLVMPAHLPEFYTDLKDERMETAIAVFHQRFSSEGNASNYVIKGMPGGKLMIRPPCSSFKSDSNLGVTPLHFIAF